MSSREASDREAAERSQRPDNIVYALDDEDSMKAEEAEVPLDELVYADSVEDRVYDDKLKRTFIVKSISFVDIKKILGTDRSEAVLNIYIVYPTGVLRTIVVVAIKHSLLKSGFGTF